MGITITQEHRTVSRVTDILEFVARSPESVRLVDMAKELDAPRSSVHGLVHGLVAAGYLLGTGEGRYKLGPAITALLRHQPMDQRYRAAMEAASLEFDETVTLVVLAGDSYVVADAIEASKAIRYQPTVGVRRPLYPTSAGKCFLAYASPIYQEKYLAKYVSEDSDRELAKEVLARAKADGYAVNAGETIPDLQAVSVPIFNEVSLDAVLTIAGPTSRIAEQLDDIVRSMREISKRASMA